MQNATSPFSATRPFDQRSMTTCVDAVEVDVLRAAELGENTNGFPFAGAEVLAAKRLFAPRDRARQNVRVADEHEQEQRAVAMEG